MPCFKGIAVSVHAEGAPLPEYSVQKQSRVSRVSTYIPVPRPVIPQNSDRLEPSKFAISITLLTPGIPIPYSQPKPSLENPHPSPQMVAGSPRANGSGRNVAGVIGPYIPTSNSENETIAAYIYFDGRVKEEVATLLRPGEETWVNSRWVQLPDSEGGGLAEREFLFREVGLERWLNGLDLDGHGAAAKIEKRRQKFEKRRRRRRAEACMIDEFAEATPRRTDGQGILRYGDDEKSPIEQISDDNYSDGSNSEDEIPHETAGQIKIAMFRVVASGEIKKGEYSPQFGANDSDEEGESNNTEEGDIDHTTSFAKPKILDPKTVSTQTVTGIDGPDNPFAVFTFFYRGERQLEKMGILSQKRPKSISDSSKRRSTLLDLSSLAPLKPGGTVGFSSFRERKPSSKLDKTSKNSRRSFSGSLDSDDNDDGGDEDQKPSKVIVKSDIDEEKESSSLLTHDYLKSTGEMIDGFGRIKLKRQHSVEPNDSTARPSPASAGTKSVDGSPPSDLNSKLEYLKTNPSSLFGSCLPDESIVGSPLKKHRASLYSIDSEIYRNQLAHGVKGSGSDNKAATEVMPEPLPSIATGMEEEEL